MEMIPELQPVAIGDQAASTLTGNTATDLANIAKEMGVTLNADLTVKDSQPVVSQEAPIVTEQPKAEEKKVEVPAKFQNADGTVNEEKLQKSLTSVEDMIAKYRAKETEAQQLQNKLNNPPPSTAHIGGQVQQPQATQFQVQLTPLEQNMAQDLINEAASQGLQLDPRMAVAQARVMARGLEAKHAAELNMTQDLRLRVEDSERRTELQAMIDSDPELLSPQMVDKLWQIRQENPEIEKSKTPWRKAYVHYLGEQAIAQRTQQVQVPNPKGSTVKAPPSPVGPVARVEKTIDLTDRKSLENLDLKQMEELIQKNFKGYQGQRRY